VREFNGTSDLINVATGSVSLFTHGTVARDHQSVRYDNGYGPALYPTTRRHRPRVHWGRLREKALIHGRVLPADERTAHRGAGAGGDPQAERLVLDGADVLVQHELHGWTHQYASPAVGNLVT